MLINEIDYVIESEFCSHDKGFCLLPQNLNEEKILEDMSIKLTDIKVNSKSVVVELHFNYHSNSSTFITSRRFYTTANKDMVKKPYPFISLRLGRYYSYSRFNHAINNQENKFIIAAMKKARSKELAKLRSLKRNDFADFLEDFKRSNPNLKAAELKRQAKIEFKKNLQNQKNFEDEAKKTRFVVSMVPHLHKMQEHINIILNNLADPSNLNNIDISHYEARLSSLKNANRELAYLRSKCHL